jgi:alkylation response protein AidB-like acyl-CoA dehydrogenase
MTYRAPIDDILLALDHGAGFSRAIAQGAISGYDAEITPAILDEASRFAAEVLAPLNRDGDKVGAQFADGKVTTAPGWQNAYRQWVEGGWNGVSAPEEFGGQGLPLAIAAACSEMWNSANLAFALCPMLTAGAIEALEAHGSAELKSIYMSKLISGEWTGTMQLTEPQAGSDVGALRTRAVRAGDGSYRLFGSKIFITYGEHDLTGNIIHFVLARLPEAPAGTRGISLFLVPKFIVNADGSLGQRNDIRAAGIEHKLGIHGSPTCTMVMGDTDGAVGYLIGEENRGMQCMFTMMNQARLNVGIEGVGIAERAYQQALAYAQERRQGRGMASKSSGSDAIIVHPDVRRMLLTMRSTAMAARTICYATAVAIDVSRRATDPTLRRDANTRAAFLTPIAKAFSTDIGIEAASIGVQVHGGMGFIEETGAAQYYRDARIAAIYEGTNGIQAIDLLTRKLAPDGGAFAAKLLKEMDGVTGRLEASNDPAFGATAARLREGTAALDRAGRWLLDHLAAMPDEALAGATPYLRLWGTTLGGVMLADSALAASAAGDHAALAARTVAATRFFAENIVVHAAALERTIIEGASSVLNAETALTA